MSNVRNITVPWVPLDEFDWSFSRSGPLPWNLTVWSIIAVFTALPIWTTVELTFWVFYTFERWRGAYFYSVLGTTWGVTIHAIGFVLKFCVPEVNWVLSTVLSEIGWVAEVCGFSLVLWSRLHLVIPGHTKLLRYVLAMIIIDEILIGVPTIVFQFLVSGPDTHSKYVPHMEIMERVQIMWFSVQETIISVIYVWGTMQLLKLSLNSKAKTTLAFLIIVQVLVVLADVLVTVLDYLGYYTLKAVLHSFVYAFKLQVEFVVLNEFKHIAKGGITGGNGSLGIGSAGFSIFNNNNVALDMPKTSGGSPVHNNSGVTVVGSARGSPSSRATGSDTSGAQNEQEADALELQYLGRYGRAV
ncbi:uncharacterized protein GGS22DRAFT_171257 [Annulohypoxylon maeteangense]|uniref:uncharacterized protein n=1 Tax=Annulohypoxylon maeteangense TaxID=1927788 RepID=UPI0020087326|nr:uncharacterized protein GGS22DRAFT_171257 [Annulohypoxylon maeteangense]KAI0881976.1 hypothetical protein GGS22DRAFT_171257 [Annulohypoxylon maeteangense]